MDFGRFWEQYVPGGQRASQVSRPLMREAGGLVSFLEVVGRVEKIGRFGMWKMCGILWMLGVYFLAHDQSNETNGIQRGRLTMTSKRQKTWNLFDSRKKQVSTTSLPAKHTLLWDVALFLAHRTGLTLGPSSSYSPFFSLLLKDQL